MRITVDIEESTLTELLELTGKRKMSPAVAEAVEGYVRRLKVSRFGKQILSGAYDSESSDGIHVGASSDSGGRK